MNARLPADHVRALDPFSPEGIREAVAKILEGHNYHLFFEDVTKRRLIATYRNLAEYRMEDEADDEKWKEAIRNELTKGGNKNSDKNLKYWLLGLTRKTAQNLGIEKSDYPALFNSMVNEIESQSSEIGLRDRVPYILLYP